MKDIDCLILGCTHYPFLVPAMKKLGLDDGFFINPAVCLAINTKEYLVEGVTLPEAYHNALKALESNKNIYPCDDWNTTQKEISPR